MRVGLLLYTVSVKNRCSKHTVMTFALDGLVRRGVLEILSYNSLYF